MKAILAVIAIVLASLGSCGARADTAEILWPSTPGVTYNIYQGAQPTSLVKVMTGLTSSRIVFTGPAVNTGYWYKITSVSNGVETPIGGVVQMAYPAPVLAAQSLKAQTTVAYYMTQVADKYVAIPVGSIAVGTACDATQSVNGYYVIPRSSVTWYGTVKPLVVVGQCG